MKKTFWSKMFTLFTFEYLIGMLLYLVYHEDVFAYVAAMATAGGIYSIKYDYKENVTRKHK